jgi:nicotinamide-nucleotide amidase
MNVFVVSIGDELLLGQTINTNASWIGTEIAKLGGEVVEGVTIKDTKEAILNSVDYALAQADVVLITGGLGPTKDDITKYTLCEYFNTELGMHQPTLDHITDFFVKRGREMLETNIQQAALPKSCEILFNENGTAPGMWFEKDDKVLVSLPGVPYEMKAIMADEVFPRLMDRFELEAIYYRTIHTQGMGESFLAEKISDIEDAIRRDGLGLAYLPSPGLVRLRLTGKKNEQDRSLIAKYMKHIEDRIQKHVFGFDGAVLSEVVGKLLIEKGGTVSTVESCTGGALAKSLTSISGSSTYYMGSLLTYSNEMKQRLADVPEQDLIENGAVSQVVVEAMAKGGMNKIDTDFCISTSGVAGPNGGTDEKPVGTVWIAIASKNRMFSKRFQFGSDRARNIEMTVNAALNLLRCEILGLNT